MERGIPHCGRMACDGLGLFPFLVDYVVVPCSDSIVVGSADQFLSHWIPSHTFNILSMALEDDLDIELQVLPIPHMDCFISATGSQK